MNKENNLSIQLIPNANNRENHIPDLENRGNPHDQVNKIAIPPGPDPISYYWLSIAIYFTLLISEYITICVRQFANDDFVPLVVQCCINIFCFFCFVRLAYVSQDHWKTMTDHRNTHAILAILTLCFGCGCLLIYAFTHHDWEMIIQFVLDFSGYSDFIIYLYYYPKPLQPITDEKKKTMAIMATSRVVSTILFLPFFLLVFVVDHVNHDVSVALSLYYIAEEILLFQVAHIGLISLLEMLEEFSPSREGH
jgi:hypothetical protein